MAEHIEREAALEEVEEWADTFCECDYVFPHSLKSIKKIPVADVRPVKRGRNVKDMSSLFECSLCGWECWDTLPGDTETYNFCPNCGADMRGEADGTLNS